MALHRSAEAIKKKIEVLAAKGDGRSLELAEALAELRAMPKPPKGDRPGLAELVEISKLSRRAVGYLIKVWERFGSLNIPRKRLSDIGWTKLAIIAEHCEAGEELTALILAETCTAKELPARLKGGPKRKKMRTVQLRFTPTQYKTFETTLLANGARLPKKGWGLACKEQALMKVIGQ